MARIVAVAPRMLRLVSSGVGVMLTSISTSSVLAVPRNATQSPTPSTSHTPNCSGELSPSELTAPLHKFNKLFGTLRLLQCVA